MVLSMGLADVLQSIKDAETAAAERVAGSKEEAAKILADARRESARIIQSAQDDSVASTVETLDAARSEASGEAEGVQKDGAKAVTKIQKSAEKRRSDAVSVIIDSIMSN